MDSKSSIWSKYGRIVLLCLMCTCYSEMVSALPTSWKGTVSTNVFNAANWSNGVPDEFKSAVIGDGSYSGTFWPQLSGELHCLDLTIGDGAVAATLSLATHKLEVHGNLDLVNNGILNLNNGEMWIHGDLSNLGIWNEGTSTVLFSGSTSSEVTGSRIDFYNLILQKTSGVVTLKTDIDIIKLMEFRVGNLVSDADEKVIFRNGSGHIGLSNVSHVAGIVAKQGDEEFTFPIGLNGFSLRPVIMEEPTAVTTTVEAKYIYGTPPNHTLYDPSFDEMGDCEYWEMSVTNGTYSGQIAPSWVPEFCLADVFPLGLRVAMWNSGSNIWESKGLGALNNSFSIDGFMSVQSEEQISLSQSTSNPTQIAFGYLDINVSSEKYAELQRYPDAATVKIFNGLLNFKYREEYNDTDGQLNYQIFETNGTVASADLLRAQTHDTHPVAIQYGINEINLDISTLAGGDYLMVVRNEKNELWYLRFEVISIN